MLTAAAYRAPWRAVAALLVAVGGASLPWIALAVWRSTDPPVTPSILIRLVLFGSALPAVAAWALRRALSVQIEIDAAALVLTRPRLRIELPLAAIADVAPWRVPLPAPGLSVRLRSGRWFEYGLQIDDAPALLEALVAAGVAPAAAATRHPTVIYAAGRPRCRRRWLHWLGKFVLFALVPAAVLFNAHQYIAYGGTLGQYYLLGLGAYLQTAAVYWSTVIIYLVLYNSLWRGPAELVALAVAWLAPARAVAVRRVAEWVVRIGYYGGVPALLWLRFYGG